MNSELNSMSYQDFLKQYKEIKKKYPHIIERIETQGNWLGLILQRFFEFLKKLALEGEFKQQLDPMEKRVYEMILKIKEIEV